MEKPITDQQRINELNLKVNQYLKWVERTDKELRELVHEQCLRLKNVNRKMVHNPVY